MKLTNFGIALAVVGASMASHAEEHYLGELGKGSEITFVKPYKVSALSSSDEPTAALWKEKTIQVGKQKVRLSCALIKESSPEGAAVTTLSGDYRVAEVRKGGKDVPTYAVQLTPVNGKAHQKDPGFGCFTYSDLKECKSEKILALRDKMDDAAMSLRRKCYRSEVYLVPIREVANVLGAKIQVKKISDQHERAETAPAVKPAEDAEAKTAEDSAEKPAEDSAEKPVKHGTATE